MTIPVPEHDRGGVNIPAADGYQFADDHPWTPENQRKLTSDLWEAVQQFQKGLEFVPDDDAPSSPEA